MAPAPGTNPTNGDAGKAGTNGVRVFYSSRYQSESIAKKFREDGTIRSITFAQKADPCIGLLGKAMSVFKRDVGMTNVAVTVQPNLNLLAGPGANEKEPNGNGNGAPKDENLELGHRGQAKSLYLATDAAVLSRVDPDTLEPIGQVHQSALHPDLKGPTSAAHGKRDPVTGDFFNYNLEFGFTPTYRVFQIVAATGEVKILATLKGGLAKAGYIHSFFITENYVVLCVPSLRHQKGGAMIPLKGNILEAMAFEDVPCAWFVIDRKGVKGVVKEFQTPPGFFFHSTNAWEEGDELVCEALWFDNADILYSFYYEVLANREGKAAEFWANREMGVRLARHRFPMKSASGSGSGDLVQPEFQIPGPHAGELPTYNTRLATRRHRFVYGVSSRGLSTMFDAIVKTDTDERSAVLWRAPRGHTPGEPIFVPRPEGVEEDDGVLLSVVLDGAKGMSYLLCLDAATMEVVGRAECEFAVGFGFHGRLVGAQ